MITDIWTLLIIAAIAQGLFVLSIVLFKGRLSSPTHLYLTAVVGVLLWFLCEFLAVRQVFDIEATLFYGTRFGSWLVLGPLIYLYVRVLDKQAPPWSGTYLFHFLPFLVFAILLPLFLSDFLSPRQKHYGMLTAFDAFNDEVSWLQYVYSSVFIFQFIHLLIYLLYSLIVINRYNKKLHRYYSTINQSDIYWLRGFIILLVVIVISVSVLLSKFFFNQEYNRDLDYLYVLPISFMIYFIGLKLSGIQWLSIKAKPEDESKYKKSSLTDEQAEQYVSDLKEYVRAHKPYLDSGLRLHDLADQLDISPNHLSQVINSRIGTSFYDFINQKRVQEAQRIFMEDEQIKILDAAYASGFNNKTSFNNAFKKFTGHTPSSYRNLKK